MTTSTPFSDLDSKLKKINTLGSISGLLSWDEQVNLPQNSNDQRAEQSALLANLAHNLATDSELGKTIASLESQFSALSKEQTLVVADARKEYDRATKLPSEFVERRSRLESEAYHAWAKAREASDFSIFAPFLQKQVDTCKELTDYLGWENSYDCLIDLHDPGMDAATISSLFSELKTDLVPIVEQILASPTKANTSFLKDFPIDEQEAFLKEVTTALGFDYKRGRIDKSLHPFCSGNGKDIRMTTRFDADNPLDSLYSSIHERVTASTSKGSHSTNYTPLSVKQQAWEFTNLKADFGKTKYAAQKHFGKHYEPKLRTRFSAQLSDVSSEDLYLAINSVSRNPIRVDSDEVTYNLHIIIRFEIENALFKGELKVADLPSYWNEQYQKLLGITPRNNAEGVLQDIHWSGGAFGYFPSYCLGNMMAAQLWYAALDQIENLEEQIAKANFKPLLDWLRDKVHQHGKADGIKGLCKQSTGNELSPKALIRYLKERYLPLYR